MSRPFSLAALSSRYSPHKNPNPTPRTTTNTTTLTPETHPQDLGAAILANMTGAPPPELSTLSTLSTLVDPSNAGDPPGSAASAVRRFASGLGTSAIQFPELPTPTTTHPNPGSTDDDMPQLFCPGPIRDNPALGELINDHIMEWAEQIGIYPNNLDRLRTANFGRLIMLTHPATNDPDRLLAAAKCIVAEWATDDYYVDEVTLGADPTILGSRLAKLHAIVDPASLPARYTPQLDTYRKTEPIATAFRTAMEHLARYASTTQMSRFQHQMSILYLAWTQEADWHTNHRTPPVWEYLVQRHLNSYLPPMILIDVLAGYELPPNEFYDPQVRRAITLAGNANVLLNDLHSSANESDTDFNLPKVIMAEEHCDAHHAIKRTIEIHNELMRTFVAQATTLSLLGSPMLRRFFADTWAWMGGSREWHATTHRYHHPT